MRKKIKEGNLNQTWMEDVLSNQITRQTKEDDGKRYFIFITIAFVALAFVGSMALLALVMWASG